MANEPLLSISDLACRRGEISLYDELSFELFAGQCCHLVGSNGSGKTSVLRQLSGLMQVDEGKIFWNSDTDFVYLAHKDGLKSQLTAFENLRFYADYYGRSQEQDIDESLNELGILHCAELPTKSLSFGQRRRLSFARVLLSRASVWLLDEPLTGIDQDGRVLLLGLIKQHLATGGGVILTNHGKLDQSAIASELFEVAL
ncbi:MAG: heme ABC exporter ATP-binding protein CcmA [Pseudomonadota bacterium]